MKKLVHLFVLFPFATLAQKGLAPAFPDFFSGRTCVATYGKQQLNPANMDGVLRSRCPNLGHPASGVVIRHKVESQTGQHYLFQQLHKGIAVYQGSVKVNTDKQGIVTSVFDNTLPITSTTGAVFPDAGAIEKGLASAKAGEIIQLRTNPVWFWNGDSFLPSVHATVSASGSAHFDLIIGNQGEVLYRRDLNSYHRQPTAGDSMVAAMIFQPDPLTSAGVVYGSPYVDSNDVDVAQLNLQRQNITLKVDYTNDTFRLKSPFGIVKEFDSPVTVPAFWKTTANFNYTRNQQEFEDVNAYYYVTMYHDYIQSLGFNNIVNYQIWIDAHAMGGADNSMFSPGFTPARLLFGEGGVDDAEDADVILHEYGHAISYSAAPNTNTGTQRQTLDEANSDYFAASYSRFVNTFNWGNVYSWDGHNPFWPGRVVISSKTYPASLVNNIYTDAEIWSATLMEIWSDIGRQTTDQLLVESMYGYASGMNMPMAAQLFIKADSTLNNGANYTSICNRFKNRGILSSCPVGIADAAVQKNIHLINTAGFASGEALSLLVPGGGSVQLTLMNAEGKLVVDEHMAQGPYELSGKDLPAGVYVLRIATGNETLHCKVVRY